jgi:3-hydroxyisobutyrate dehydrogenase-like beta-hydroxyacid dehydrogenase
METKRIGFVGLGLMGSAMAGRLLEAGQELVVYNRSKEKCYPFLKKGASVAENLKNLGLGCDRVISMVSDEEALENLVFGPEGLLEGLGIGKTLIHMGTISPTYALELAERLNKAGVALWDAPVSGSERAARTGDLVILASGPQADFEEIRSYLEILGRKVLYCGEAGKGSVIKLALNLILGVLMEGLGEALSLVKGWQIEEGLFWEALKNGPLFAPIYGLKEASIREGDFTPQFPLKHMAKDLAYFQRAAYPAGAPTPVAGVLAGLYLMAREKGLGDEDVSAILKLFIPG